MTTILLALAIAAALALIAALATVTTLLILDRRANAEPWPELEVFEAPIPYVPTQRTESTPLYAETVADNPWVAAALLPGEVEAWLRGEGA